MWWLPSVHVNSSLVVFTSKIWIAVTCNWFLFVSILLDHMQLDTPESPESSDMQEIHSLGVYQSCDTQISKSDMKTITGSSYHVSENIFFMGKRSSPPVRVFNRRCWCPHHQRFQIRTGGVDVPITNGSGTGGDGPAITNDLNPTVPKTVGDGV